MISICIPTYEQKGQGAYFLTQLLTSIRAQTYTGEYEVVISDNATDGSIKKVADNFPLPIVYYFNPVRGASENINNAIALARYDKIKLMMQDDLFIHPLALQIFDQALDGAGWAVSFSTHINALGQKTGQRIAVYNPTNFESNTIGMPTVIGFKKSHVRFLPELKTFCDLYFYYQLYQLYGMPEVIPSQLVAQRFHNASLSRNQAPSHSRDRRYLISKGLIPGTLPRVVVAVVCYKRYDNMERWLDCWAQCDTHGAQLVFIFNNDNTPGVAPGNFNNSYLTGVKVINRPNIGYDIGAFQDVCKKRLPGFPEYDYLLWCTDDTIPMQKDFISPFLDGFDKRTAVTCMQISNEYRRHIRTTGFCITPQVAARLRWAVDPITTVADCHNFEHRGGRWTLLGQVEAWGMRAIQITADFEKSPLYDMGFWYRNEAAKKLAPQKDRMNEHNSIFNTQQIGTKPGDFSISQILPLVFLWLLLACSPSRKNPINAGGFKWSAVDTAITFQSTPGETVLPLQGSRVGIKGDFDTLPADPDDFYPELEDIKLVRQDTTAAVLLICDTARINEGIPLWKRGYIVSKVYCCINVYSGEYAIYQPGEYKEFSEYLGPDRKPLPKNILIWLSK